MKKYYVCGFLFNRDHSKVALIRKSKPEWQKGLFNGVGGKIELYDESPEYAMKREFKEETGLEIDAWQHFLKLERENSAIWYFTATSDRFEEVRTMEDKGEDFWKLEVHAVLDNPRACVPNLSWIIQLALTDDEFTGTINIKHKNKSI